MDIENMFFGISQVLLFTLYMDIGVGIHPGNRGITLRNKFFNTFQGFRIFPFPHVRPGLCCFDCIIIKPASAVIVETVIVR